MTCERVFVVAHTASSNAAHSFANPAALLVLLLGIGVLAATNIEALGSVMSTDSDLSDILRTDHTQGSSIGLSWSDASLYAARDALGEPGSRSCEPNGVDFTRYVLFCKI